MRKTIAVFVVVFLFAASFAMAAQQAKAAKAPASHQAAGVVKSVDDTSLVLTHKVSGKDQDITFVLNAQTKKTGTIKVGEKVVVHYKVEGGQNIATVVAGGKK
jgi:hypothetical protein